MGVRLSVGGGLTFSQKKGKDVKEQSKLLGKLSDMSINKPILAEVEKIKVKKVEAAKNKGYERAQQKIQKAGRRR